MCQLYFNKVFFLRPSGRQRGKSPLGNLIFKVTSFSWCPGSCVLLLSCWQKASDPELGILIRREHLKEPTVKC